MHPIQPSSPHQDFQYVPVRRYLASLETSLAQGTQWAVFENNGEQLWTRVRSSVTDFLMNEWQSGKLKGSKAEDAFFVRCDNSTMTQNDIDNGRLVVVIGVAPVKPAEFIVFQIGQWTGSAEPPKKPKP
jgi:phage tail sheath protein FI